MALLHENIYEGKDDREFRLLLRQFSDHQQTLEEGKS